jgi:hypothetical protein
MLFYFDGKFVSGGYNGSYNNGNGSESVTPFRDWSGFATSGPDYSIYGDTSYNDFKWIALDVTSYRTSSTRVNLSGLKINGVTPSLSQLQSGFGLSHEVYIYQQGGNFGSLGKNFDFFAKKWYDVADNDNIESASNFEYGVVFLNEINQTIEAVINQLLSSSIYLIVGLKNDDTNPNYFTFS